MKINNAYQYYQQNNMKKNIDNINNDKKTNEKTKADNDQRLKLMASEFTSILLKQMFKSMRETIPESKLIDGGFSEDVFTDMLDTEISKNGSSQQMNELSQLLYRQLKQKGV